MQLVGDAADVHRRLHQVFYLRIAVEAPLKAAADLEKAVTIGDQLTYQVHQAVEPLDAGADSLIHHHGGFPAAFGRCGLGRRGRLLLLGFRRRSGG